MFAATGIAVYIVPGVVAVALITLLSVFLIFSCTDCFGTSNEYELLIGPNQAKQKAVTLNHLQQAENAQAVKEDMVTDVLYYLRSIPNTKLLSEYKLWGIAWRGSRANFLVEMEEKVHLLTLSKVKPEPFSLLPWSRKGSQMFTSIFQKLQHPYIQSVTRAEFLIESNSVVVASIFSNEGSLRDRLYDRCEPTLNWTKKYRLSAVKPLRQSEYCKFGRQILEGLYFLNQMGVPYTHLHCGNVIIRSDVARITQIENGILQLDRQNERLFKQVEKRFPAFYAKSDLDVISFGLVMYEMAVGTALNNLTQIDELTAENNAAKSNNLPIELVNILKGIFLENASNAPYTLLDLCNHNFFNTISGFKRPEVVPLDKTLQLMLGSKSSLPEHAKSNPSLNISQKSRRVVEKEEPVTKGWQPGPNAVITQAPRLMQPRVVNTSSASTTSQPSPTAQTNTNSNLTYVTSNTQPQQARPAQQAAPQAQATSPRPAQQSPQAAPKSAPVSPTPAPKPQPAQSKPAQPSASTTSVSEDKEQPPTDNAHLLAIQGFGLARLKKTVTNDRSAPKF